MATLQQQRERKGEREIKARREGGRDEERGGEGEGREWSVRGKRRRK